VLSAGKQVHHALTVATATAGTALLYLFQCVANIGQVPSACLMLLTAAVAELAKHAGQFAQACSYRETTPLDAALYCRFRYQDGRWYHGLVDSWQQQQQVQQDVQQDVQQQQQPQQQQLQVHVHFRFPTRLASRALFTIPLHSVYTNSHSAIHK
jgi:hypothetical protein